MRTIGAGQFKAKCLGLLDEVESKRVLLAITKNGKVVAHLVPPPLEAAADPIFGFYRGKLKITGDVIAPTHTEAECERFLQRSEEQLHDPAGSIHDRS